MEVGYLNIIKGCLSIRITSESLKPSIIKLFLEGFTFIISWIYFHFNSFRGISKYWHASNNLGKVLWSYLKQSQPLNSSKISYIVIYKREDELIKYYYNYSIFCLSCYSLKLNFLFLVGVGGSVLLLYLKNFLFFN